MSNRRRVTPNASSSRAAPSRAPTSASSSRGSSASQSLAIQIGKMVKEESERKYLRQHARTMSSGTPAEKRRIRDEARQKGKEAYAAALERTIRTTESEKQALRALFRTYENDRKQLVAHLRMHGYNFNH